MKILLDTAFLLPSFGVKVQGIDEDRLIALLKNLRESGVEFAYPKLLLVELIAKIGKEALRKGELPPEALEAPPIGGRRGARRTKRQAYSHSHRDENTWTRRHF